MSNQNFIQPSLPQVFRKRRPSAWPMRFQKTIDQRYAAHAAVLSTKADIEALRADVFKALTDQTWKLAGVVLAGMAFVVAALKFTP